MVSVVVGEFGWKRGVKGGGVCERERHLSFSAFFCCIVMSRLGRISAILAVGFLCLVFWDYLEQLFWPQTVDQ